MYLQILNTMILFFFKILSILIILQNCVYFNIMVDLKEYAYIHFHKVLTVYVFSWQIFQLILQLFKNQEDDLHHKALTGKRKLGFSYSRIAWNSDFFLG